MGKITFMGAGSTVFAKNVLGDAMLTAALCEYEYALYDIDAERLEDSYRMLRNINKNCNKGRAKITKHLGVENRKRALKNADFVVNAIQVGGYEPCTVTDFEIPKKFGLRQTIGDTLGIGGIFRALRTIPVLEDFARDMEKVCPDAWFLNYTNPMAMLTGYMQRYTGIHTIGLCHSVQCCAAGLLADLGIQAKPPVRDVIAGINHMGWLLSIRDGDGNDLYPEIRRRAIEKLESGEPMRDLVRYEYIRRLGYYCTESSEHNAEYNNLFLKSNYPALIDRYSIPLDEYPRRCVEQIARWKDMRDNVLHDAKLTHTRTHEYASYIMEAIAAGGCYEIGGNVINKGGLIENLPQEACVEVPCLVNRNGILPCRVGSLPEQLAAMNRTNINAQLMTIEAAVTKRREAVYQAAMLDPHTSSELSIDDIVGLCDALIEAHGKWLPEYR